MKKHLLYIAIFTLLVGCDQSEWLDVKSNKSDVVPSTLEDYQALLNDYETLNNAGPALGALASDNYHTTDAIWSSVSEYDRNGYIWAKDISEWSYDWTKSYEIIAVSNIVLEGIEQFSDKGSTYDQIRATALFFRALNFFNLILQYADTYDKATASEDLGIVLKLTASVEEPVKRNTVEETYSQIIQDLNEAIKTLPDITSIPTKPTKSAAIALLGKVYFYMEDYEGALSNISIVLDTHNDLLDFNTLNSSAAFPFPTMQAGHVEVIFYMRTVARALTTISRRFITQQLYDTYDDNDLRKAVYFNPANVDQIRFKGFYTGLNSQDFAGIATNELYLTAAECHAKLGNQTDALELLNALLEKRYVTNTLPVLSFANDDELLRKILLERNKELPFTGIIRWTDLKRLNKDPRFAITLTRTINENIYTLPPNDKRYVFALPDDEIIINGLQQNER